MNLSYLPMAFSSFQSYKSYYRFHLLDIRSARSRSKAYYFLYNILQVLDRGRDHLSRAAEVVGIR